MHNSDEARDRIIVQNMRFNGRHGVSDEERSTPQSFGVDIELVRSLQIAGHSDLLANTIDYAKVYETAQDVVENSSFKLVESIAENIAERVLSRFIADEAIIRVWKNNPPLAGPADYAGVQIHRLRPSHTKAYLSLGSNVGDREENLFHALAMLDDATARAHVTKVSPIYETEPVGNPNQGWFLNICVEVSTELPPATLHELTCAIEDHLNQGPKVKWQPRIIDLDVILFGSQEIQTETLQVPHAHMAERAFVLRPLTDIAPDVRHPDGTSALQMLSRLVRHEEVRLYKH